MAAALRQGTTVAQEASRLGVELTRIAWGLSDVAPAKGDRRFTDPAWTSNPAFRIIQQTYLASAQAWTGSSPSWAKTPGGARAEQARLRVNIMTSAAAPTNFLVRQPRRHQARIRNWRPEPGPGSPQLRPRRPP